MSEKICELFSVPTRRQGVDWEEIVAQQHCPFLGKKCQKIRKSAPDISIGTCSVNHGAADPRGIVICPFRYLEKSQIFFDCMHLLTLYQPGDELHKVPEIEIPGGSVDYFLTAVRNGRVVDFVGIELQALDTTGTLWPARQAFLKSVGLDVVEADSRPYGMNWKMTAKTTLIQLHHKAETFQLLNKHLVLVFQDDLLAYMKKEFNFSNLHAALAGDAMHFHPYSLQVSASGDYRLSLGTRESTDLNGLSAALGLQANANVELEIVLQTLQSKISDRTRLQLQS